jgi:hypothetical protein
MNDQIDPLARRAAQVEQEAKNTYGEDNWASAMRSLERQVADGRLEGADIARKLTKPTAATDLFYQAVGEMSEQEWRAWRSDPNYNPKKAARIKAAER